VLPLAVPVWATAKVEVVAMRAAAIRVRRMVNS
jgi:hypothetical protein